MSDLKNFLKGKTFVESLKEFKKHNIDTRIYKDIYLVYPNVNQELNDSDFVKQCNYTYIDKKTNDILHYFSQIEELYTDFEQVLNYAKTCDDYKMMLRCEGTLIKIYYHNNEWKIGTNRNPEAQMSFWNSKKSFKELFYECILENYESVTDFYNTLEKGYCYSFVMQNPDNNMCIKTGDYVIHQINRVNLETMKEELNENMCFNHEEIAKKFIEILLKNQKLTANYVFYMYKNDTVTRVVVESEEIKKLKEIYGNCKDIRIRYLTCLNDKPMLDAIRENYPQYSEDYDEIETDMSILLYGLCIVYHNIYVKKERVTLNGIHKKILYDIHGEYLKTKKDVDINTVKDVLNNYNHGELHLAFKTKLKI